MQHWSLLRLCTDNIQGYSLAKTGQPLFDDDFEACEYGYVIKSVYNRYCSYGKNGIDEINEVDPTPFTNEQIDIIASVLNEYGKYSESQLVDLIHQPGSPWANTSQGEIISKELIKEYFDGQHALSLLKDRIRKLPVEEPVRYDNGIPVYSKKSKGNGSGLNEHDVWDI
ncbi:MAG: DUF4065 domain-containing protein [Clostridia bacterium]|nr:DUF4065 domain-containing protein [Clostridia bacterium]